MQEKHRSLREQGHSWFQNVAKQQNHGDSHANGKGTRAIIRKVMSSTKQLKQGAELREYKDQQQLAIKQHFKQGLDKYNTYLSSPPPCQSKLKLPARRPET